MNLLLIEFDQDIGPKIIQSFPNIEINSFVLNNSFPDYKTDTIPNDSFFYEYDGLFYYVYFKQIKNLNKARAVEQKSYVFVSNFLDWNICNILNLIADQDFFEIYMALFYYSHTKLSHNNLFFEDINNSFTCKMNTKTENNINLEIITNELSNINFKNRTLKIFLDNYQEKVNRLEFSEFKFIKPFYHFFIEAILLSKKIKIISRLPSNLCKFTKYVYKIMLPLHYTDKSLTYLSMLNIKSIKEDYKFLGVSSKYTLVNIDFDLIINIDQKEVSFQKNKFKHSKFLKLIDIKEKEKPVEFLMNYKLIKRITNDFYKELSEMDKYNEFFQ